VLCLAFKADKAERDVREWGCALRNRSERRAMCSAKLQGLRPPECRGPLLALQKLLHSVIERIFAVVIQQLHNYSVYVGIYVISS
jgi:hypothetical protein